MITPGFSLTATERILPRLALDFTTASLDPRVTFTRSGNTATVTNSSGYIQTVNADIPRFDYNPTTLACRGLLIEEARTNVLLYSEDYSDAAYWGSSAVTTTTSQLDPKNTNTATKRAQTDTTTAVVAAGTSNEPTISSGETVTFSIYLKSNTARWVVLQIGPSAASGSTSRLRGWFDILNGVAGSVSNVGAATGATISIHPAANGYFRCVITGALNDSLTKCRTLLWAAAADNDLNRAPTSSGTYTMWGTQVERKTFATSYIPTSASQVTRNADVASMTGTNFSSWFNTTEGAMSVQASVLKAPVGQTSLLSSINDNSVANRLQLNIDTTVAAGGEYYVVSGSSGQADIVTSSAITSNTQYKWVYAYKQNSFALGRGGSLIGTDSSGSVPSGLTQLNIGDRNSANTAPLNGHIQKLLYWPQRITNAEVQAFSNG